MNWITNNQAMINFIAWTGLMIATFGYNEAKETVAQGLLALLGILSFIALGATICFAYMTEVFK